jgi:hypothetical protein
MTDCIDRILHLPHTVIEYLCSEMHLASETRLGLAGRLKLSNVATLIQCHKTE